MSTQTCTGPSLDEFADVTCLRAACFFCQANLVVATCSSFTHRWLLLDAHDSLTCWCLAVGIAVGAAPPCATDGFAVAAALASFAGSAVSHSCAAATWPITELLLIAAVLALVQPRASHLIALAAPLARLTPAAVV